LKTGRAFGLISLQPAARMCRCTS